MICCYFSFRNVLLNAAPDPMVSRGALQKLSRDRRRANPPSRSPSGGASPRLLEEANGMFPCYLRTLIFIVGGDARFQTYQLSRASVGNPLIGVADVLAPFDDHAITPQKRSWLLRCVWTR